MRKMKIISINYPFSHLLLQKRLYYCKYSLKDSRLIYDIDCLYSDRKSILKHKNQLIRANSYNNSKGPLAGAFFRHTII